MPRFSTSPCDRIGSDEPSPLDGITTANGVDYVELRYATTLVAAAGWRCAKSRDAARCNRSYGTVVPPPSGPHLVVERGGGFTTVVTQAEVTAVLGPIDTLADAALAALVQGQPLLCASGRPFTGQAEDSGWVFAASTLRPTDAGHVEEGVIIHVGRDATVRTEPARLW